MPHNNQHISAWNALLNGEHSSLEELYNQHYIGLLNYGIKLTHQREAVRDCIFQLFLNLWDGHKKLPAVTNVRSYLITCLHRALLTQEKKRRPGPVNATSWEQIYPDKEFSYEEHLVQTQQNQEIKTKLMLAFDKLSAREKELLRLKFFEDWDYDEIARHCNISKRTAYNIVHAALKALREGLAGEFSGKNKSRFVAIALRSILF